MSLCLLASSGKICAKKFFRLLASVFLCTSNALFFFPLLTMEVKWPVDASEIKDIREVSSKTEPFVTAKIAFLKDGEFCYCECVQSENEGNLDAEKSPPHKKKDCP